MSTYLTLVPRAKRYAQARHNSSPSPCLRPRLDLVMWRDLRQKATSPNYWITSVIFSAFGIIVTRPRRPTSTGSRASFSFITNDTLEKWARKK